MAWLLVITKARKVYFLDDKEMFSQIDFANAIRYNQGDAYFVGEEVAGTKVGEVDEPMLIKALKESE